ncbi:hypothetical protein AX17_002448 [Amanita inopinata Kibby_2008]|nr:hypothetical protein AX17_002448 [Amanita inopinata Kibby_2008]
MLGMLAKSRRANTIAQRVNATSNQASRNDQRRRRKSDGSSDAKSGSSASDVSPRILDDDALMVEEPSFTVIPKSEERTDIEQEWTEVGIEGDKEKARARKSREEIPHEEGRGNMQEARGKDKERTRGKDERDESDWEIDRKRREEEELKRKDEERRRKKEEEEEWKRRHEEEWKRRSEEERTAREEEWKTRHEQEWERRNEEERKAREEEWKRRSEQEWQRRDDEERKRRNEEDRRRKENYEVSARTREERARKEERERQDKLRAQEREKFESDIRERREREKVLQERIATLEREQNAYSSQLREMLRQSDLLESQNRLLKDQLQRQSDELRALGNQIYDPSSKVTRFLSKGVARSGKPTEQEVVALVELLNSEIYQAAACIVDQMESHSQIPTKVSQRTAAEEIRVTKMLGRRTIEVLTTKSSKGAELDPLMVQVALQMSMNYCCSKITSAWCPGMWSYSDFVSTLFTRIRGSEDSTTASKWRAVTRAQFKQTESTQASMVRFITDHVADLLVFVGLRQTSRDWVLEMLKERSPLIVATALQINNAIGEDIATDHLEVVLVRAEETFDDNNMDNTYGDDGADCSARCVVATTDLGLRRATAGSKQESMISKPKVILSSAFDAETRQIFERTR